jgi:hypothetical protein
MPFSKAKNQLVANDAQQRRLLQEDAEAKLGLTHTFAYQEEVDATTGLFTYTFEQNDYVNLRQSVIQSLRKSDAFSEVIDVSDGQPAEDSLRLVLVFAESGIVKTPATFKCILNGTARVEGGSADAALACDIAIKATSLLSVSGAKSKAIEMYLAKIGELLKSL